MTSPLEKMRNVLVNMPPEHRKKLIEAYQEFSRLKSWCEAKKQIEILPKMQGIKVLKNTPDVKKLKKIVDFLNPGSFKWEAKTRKIAS
jgi:hypothetical protein